MTSAPNISPLDQARILSEVLPHMQQYDEETIVIKYGGHAMGAEHPPPAVARDTRGAEAAPRVCRVAARHQAGGGACRRAADRDHAEGARHSVGIRRRTAHH